MKNSNAIFQIIIVVVGAILALTMGLQVGTQDFRTLVLWFLIGGAILYVLKGYHYTWQLIFFITFLSFSMRPVGFEISSSHVAFLLGMALAGMTIFRPTMPTAGAFNGTGIQVLQFVTIVWIGYGGLHFMYNHFDPVYPTEWNLKNALSRYFLAFSGPCLLAWFSLFPKGIELGKNWVRTIFWCLAAALAINIVLRFYMMFFLGLELHGDRGEFYAEQGLVYVPYINLIPTVEVLRILGPLSVGFAYSLLTHDRWMRLQGWIMRLMVYGVFGMGLFGSVFSGGRAAVVLAIFYVVVLSVMRRKFFHIALGMGMAFGLFVFANLSSHWVKYEAPFAVSRSLQNLLIEKGGAADSSIRSSTNWREELFERAIDEWYGDQRIFWTGRATMVYDSGDANIRSTLGGYQAGIESALRRGATHNVVTDLLIQYGLFGLLIYYLMILLMIKFVWSCQRRGRGDANVEAFCSFLVIHLVAMLIYKTLGSGFFEVHHFWMVVILMVAMRAYAIEARGTVAKERERRVVSPLGERGLRTARAR